MKKSTKIIIGGIIVGLCIGGIVFENVKKKKDLEAFYQTEHGKEIQAINDSLEKSKEESKRIDRELDQIQEDYYWLFEE